MALPVVEFDVMRTREAETPLAEATVVVSLRDDSASLLDALESVRLQTLPHLDLVIVDDCSADDSAAVALRWLRRHEERFDRATLIRHRSSGGVSAARNSGVSVASTPYYFPLDARNAIYPRCLTRCLETLRDSQAEAAYTQLERFGTEIGIGTADVWLKARFAKADYVGGMALVKRSVWEEVDGYDRLESEELEDYAFWCKVIERGYEGIFIPEALCRSRVLEAHSREANDADRRLRTLYELSVRHPWIDLESLSSPTIV